MIRENIIKDLSSEFTENKVYLCENEELGRVIKKTYKYKSGFDREIEAMKNIDKQFRPDIYYVSTQEKIIYSSYNPMEKLPENSLKTLVELAKNLHDSSSKFGRVNDPGEKFVTDNWIEYLIKKGEKWLVALNKLEDYSSFFYSQIESLKNGSEEMIKNKVCIIHRDIRIDNIGMKDGEYILFDYELAMWGDRYWDVARMLFENIEHYDFICKEYGLSNSAFIKSYVKLFSMSFADYLVRSSIPQKRNLEKCINIIKDF